MESDKIYTIREVSKMFDLPVSTLRYYEDEGILTNVGRSSSNQRIYYETHINRLRSICCFKRTGMSIAKLKDFFSLLYFCPASYPFHSAPLVESPV